MENLNEWKRILIGSREHIMQTRLRHVFSILVQCILVRDDLVAYVWLHNTKADILREDPGRAQLSLQPHEDSTCPARANIDVESNMIY